MSNVLVFNDSFFEISQTFVYHQIEALSDHFDVDLLSYNFKNPHNFDTRSYNKYKINRPDKFLGKVTSKLYRSITGSTLHLDLSSHLLLRKILSLKNYEAIHAHFGYNGLKILHYAKSHGIPLVVTFHGHDASSMLRDKKYKNRLVELFDYASAIILVSEHMVDMLNVKPWIDKVKIVPCAVDPQLFKTNGFVGSNDKIKILHAGRITPKKGVPDLIKVFANLSKRFNNLELHIAGNGEELDKCKRLVEKFGLSKHVIFYGSVSHDKINTTLKMCDIFVLNSRVADDGDMEGTPVSLLEAMSLSKPVVSTYHAGIPYVIENGFNGLLVEEYDNKQLEESLTKLVLDKSLRTSLGLEARKTILNSYTISNMKQKIELIYSGITKTIPSPLIDKPIKFSRRDIA